VFKGIITLTIPKIEIGFRTIGFHALALQSIMCWNDFVSLQSRAKSLYQPKRKKIIALVKA
jgi:hypothetical protein